MTMQKNLTNDEILKLRELCKNVDAAISTIVYYADYKKALDALYGTLLQCSRKAGHPAKITTTGEDPCSPTTEKPGPATTEEYKKLIKQIDKTLDTYKIHKIRLAISCTVIAAAIGLFCAGAPLTHAGLAALSVSLGIAAFIGICAAVIVAAFAIGKLYAEYKVHKHTCELKPAISKCSLFNNQIIDESNKDLTLCNISL